MQHGSIGGCILCLQGEQTFSKTHAPDGRYCLFAPL
jgi:hypothetical protein